jgi:hypothetical protein
VHFNNHLGRVLAGSHALLSPSNYHWINYDEAKLDRVFHSSMDAKRGTELHEIAHRLIKAGVRLPDNGQTLSLYVNDAIGFRMQPEQMLWYSENCFGTADCISFNEIKKFLRISDLKNGVNEASMSQLKIYASIFCLEYGFKPLEISIELRIYQNDEVRVEIPDPDEIFHIMDKIVVSDRRIRFLKKGVTS